MKKVVVFIILLGLVCVSTAAYCGISGYDRSGSSKSSECAKKQDSKWNRDLSIINPKPSIISPVTRWVTDTVTYIFSGEYPPDRQYDVPINESKNEKHVPTKGKTRNPDLYTLSFE